MAIIICPSCGGKISSTRTSCSHCGYEIEAPKICPECEETIDMHAKECPVCGYEFDSVPMDKTHKEEPVKENEAAPPPSAPSSPREAQSDKVVCEFHRLTTKEQFLRSILLYLSEHKDSPVDVLKANFDEVEEDQIQGFVATGVANGHYSATIGYDRIEKYVEQEYGFVGAHQHYTCNGHPKVGTGENVMHDVEKTRTVTDWQPYNGNIINKSCRTVITEPPYGEWTYKIRELIDRKDIDSLYDETAETTESSNNLYSEGRKKLAATVEYGISFPGDQIKDPRCSVSISDYILIRCVVPIYKVYYEYEGKKYCAKGFAIDGVSPIVELPKGSQSAPTETGLRNQEERAVAKVKKPLDAFKISCIILSVLSGLLALGNFTVMMVVRAIISFSVMVCCIIGAIIFSKTASKKVGLIERAYNARINKLKELKGLLFNKKITEFGLSEITESEKIRLGLSDVALEENIDIDSFTISETATDDNSTYAEDKGNSTVAKNGKPKGIFPKLLAVFDIFSLVALIVGSVCMIYDTNIFTAFRNQEPSDVGYLLALASAVIVFILLSIQLFFDISKKANFKKTLITTIIAIIFNMVAVFFACHSLITNLFGVPLGTIMFIIFAAVCLLFTVIRLILANTCKKR